MFDIITFGSATQDILLKPKHLTVLNYKKEVSAKEVCFPMGSKIDIEDMQFNTGGGGTNTAATFALQGLKTAFCGVIGRDISGQEIINELKKFKINTDLVQTTDKKRTNHSVVMLNTGSDRTIMAYRGAAELMDKNNIPWNKLKTKWLYLAPLSGLLCDSFEDLVNFAFDKKIKLAVNPGMAQLSLPNFPQIAKKIDVLIMNQEEASFLTKIPYETEKEIFQKIDDMCSGIVIMTKGPDGVLVSDGNHIYSAVPPVHRIIVDTTGAGDSFSSGFLSEFIRTGDLEKGIQLGMGNSVGCLSQVGAKNGLLKKDQEFEKV
ncbi:MAG: carbohydrate kinase family protein, partial [Candidatus Staskawiczbacteria bacterium]|nr:carbohydrate kinase family protein [Candidatus Staskawiczbacteria bacterium]